MGRILPFIAPLLVATMPVCAAPDHAVPEAGQGYKLRGTAAAPEIVPGRDGAAWRSNGYSSYLAQSASLDGARPLAVSLQVALESWPSDQEVPADRLSPSSFVNQAADGRGFDLWVDTFGRWGATLATAGGTLRLPAPGRFPLYRWATIDFSYDPLSGRAMLLLDGTSMAQATAAPGTAWLPADADLLVARPAKTVDMLNFTVNLLNGAFDAVQVSQQPVPVATGQAGATPTIEQSLAVPEARFAADPLRPRFHAMPPANWTNEPHGLVLAGGRYHLFYQRTPNGPYKTQMVWGHMSSADLVNWTHHRDALRPEVGRDGTGFDMKGIWSGDVVMDEGTAYAFYTSVNHGTRYNPGISVAVTSDPLLRHWQKRGPIIGTDHVADMRDPYLWQEGDSAWHMIIGAALDGGGGGLDHYTCADLAKPRCWRHAGQLTSIPFARMDVGSDIWEMPVFEQLGGKRLLIANPIGGAVSKYGDPATRGLYWLGDWQDGRFVPDRAQPRPLDLFPGHLSPTVARQTDGTLAAIGIVDERRTSQAQEDAGWAHTFSLPREYFLNRAGTLGQRPLPALAGLRREETAFVTAIAQPGTTVLADAGQQAELMMRFNGNATGPFGVVLARSPDGQEQTSLLYDPATRRFTLDKSASSLSGSEEGPQVLEAPWDEVLFGEPRDWRVFVDGSVVEVFIGDGAAFSFRIYPTRADATQLAVFTGDTGMSVQGSVWRLSPARLEYDFSAGQ